MNAASLGWESVETSPREELGIISLHKVHWEWFVGRISQVLERALTQICPSLFNKLEGAADKNCWSGHEHLSAAPVAQWLLSSGTANREVSAWFTGILQSILPWIDGNLCRKVNNLQLERFYLIRAFCCQGAAQEGLQILSCPTNNVANSWFRFPFSNPVSEPGAGVLSSGEERDGVAVCPCCGCGPSPAPHSCAPRANQRP